MEVRRDRVVTLHYRVSDSTGAFTERSEGREPLVYLHGHGNLIPGLEGALRGKQAGERFEATVPARDAYGVRDARAVQRVAIKHLARAGKLAAGQVVTVNTEAGPRQATVLKVGRFNVDLDFNHPLAGRDLVFEIEVLEVREATETEIAHGHAHRPGDGHE